MSFPEAIKAIPADLALHPNSKFKRSAQIAKLFIDEARGIVSMIPYGVRAKLVHKLTPKATEMISKDRGERRMQFKETRVSVKKDFKYGEDERQKFDVYLPPARSIRRGKKDDYDDDDEYERTGGGGRKCESSHGGIRPRRRVGIWRTVAVCTPRASISRRRHSHGGYFVFLVPGEVGLRS